MLRLFCGAIYTPAEQEYIKLDSITQLIYTFYHFGPSCSLKGQLCQTGLYLVEGANSYAKVELDVKSMIAVKTADVTALLRRELTEMSSLSPNVLTLYIKTASTAHKHAE